MLIVHRRHVEGCPHRHKGRDFRKCDYPLWIDWRVGRKRIQKPLGTRDWGEKFRPVSRHRVLKQPDHGAPVRLSLRVESLSELC
jgi:hypothetical protein